MKGLSQLCYSLLVLLCTAHARGAEYFVSKQGADTNEGRSAAAGFATIAKGVSALKPGDTLTILPGTYFESVSAQLSGKPGSPITIRRPSVVRRCTQET